VAEKAKILLVDDRAENIVALEAILSSLNQTLVPARSGDAALKALLSDEFAVILLDVLMPGMDGFETAAHIKRRPKTRDVPIIFLTARNAEPDYAFRSYSAGAVDYIAKPFDPWVLRAKVSVFVDLYMKNRQLSDQATLLRVQLGDSLETARLEATQRDAAENATADVGPVLAELSGRLAAVEDMVTVLSGQAAAADGAGMAESVGQLEHRVARLRGVFDALRVES
jgi:CheY-like chemotaxis protein